MAMELRPMPANGTIDDKIIQALALSNHQDHQLYAKQCLAYIGSMTRDMDSATQNRFENLTGSLVSYFLRDPNDNSRTIQSCINEHASCPDAKYQGYFGFPGLNDEDKKLTAKNNILRALGIWLGMPAYFQQTWHGAGSGHLYRPVLLIRRHVDSEDAPPAAVNQDDARTAVNQDVPPPAVDQDSGRLAFDRGALRPTMNEHPDSYDFLNHENLDFTPSNLMEQTAIYPRAIEGVVEVPHDFRDVDHLLSQFESQQIDEKEVNIKTLQDYANVGILWTDNICRHMMLSLDKGQAFLELFGFPQVTQVKLPLKAGHPLRKYMVEVWDSYPRLFADSHRVLDKMISSKTTSRHVDLRTVKHIVGKKNNAREESWNTEKFPILWPRLEKIKDHLDKAEPTKWRNVWRDRRKPINFLGLLLAGAVIPIALLALGIAAAQLWAAIKTIPPPDDKTAAVAGRSLGATI